MPRPLADSFLLWPSRPRQSGQSQQFNTTSSIGRLTLNVLLSFAQFERGVTGERICDKIAAPKQKGMWMGGNVPLGYNGSERTLIINPAEAEAVRHIFTLYRELGCVRRVKQAADRRGRPPKGSGMPRFVLAAFAIGVAVLWTFVPYAYRVGEMQYMTFRSITLTATRHVAKHRDWRPQDALRLPIFLGLWAPLYPALQAARLLVAPNRLAGRRRWVWFVEGPTLMLLSLAGWWQADWALADWNWGATASPVLYPPFWVLPGGAALAGLLALAIGIAPRSRFARFLLG
jgi:hypothetical protein